MVSCNCVKQMLLQCRYVFCLFFVPPLSPVSGVMFMSLAPGNCFHLPYSHMCGSSLFPPLVILSNRLQSLSVTVFNQDPILWCSHKLGSMHLTLTVRVVSLSSKSTSISFFKSIGGQIVSSVWFFKTLMCICPSLTTTFSPAHMHSCSRWTSPIE